MTRSMLATAVLLLALLPGAAAARAEAPRAEVPAEKFAGQIQAYTDAAGSADDALASMLALAREMPTFTKGDVPLIKAYMEQTAAAWSGAAKTLAGGDEAGAAALVKRAQELDAKREIWNRRLGWRRGQAQIEYLPASEQSYDWLVGDRTADEVREIDAFIEAKKRRSEAYGRLADAATPAADPQALNRLQDEVFAADVEVQVADMKMNWAREDRDARRWVMTDPSVTSPELTEAKRRLADWRRQYEQTYRQSREVGHALEVQKRQYKELSAAPAEAYKAAKADHDRDRAKK
jgi:hypothetical protein